MLASKSFISVKYVKGLSQVKVIGRNVAVKTHFAVKSVYLLCVNITVSEVAVNQKWVNATLTVMYSWWLNFRLGVGCRS